MSLRRFASVPSDIITRFSNGSDRYTITWMSTDTVELDSIYLSVNYQDDVANEVKPPLTERSLYMLDEVCELLLDM